MKIVKKFQLKIVIFTAVKNRCILHRRVFVMVSVYSKFYSIHKICLKLEHSFFMQHNPFVAKLNLTCTFHKKTLRL